MDKYILDDNNNPVPVADLRTYYAWKESFPKEQQTGIGLQLAGNARGEISDSTVFLGSDHRHGGSKPVLWETMVFGGEHNEWGERYTSHAAALAGHKLACQKFLGNPAWQ
jgi:hypothetical protein